MEKCLQCKGHGPRVGWTGPTQLHQSLLWVKVWIWVGVITQTQHQQRITKLCEWWFASVVSREDMLRRGRGNLHQQGDADRDAGYSWGTGAVEDEGDRCLDSSYSCHDRVTPRDSARPLVCYRLKSDHNWTPPMLCIHLRSDSWRSVSF